MFKNRVTLKLQFERIELRDMTQESGLIGHHHEFDRFNSDQRGHRRNRAWENFAIGVKWNTSLVQILFPSHSRFMVFLGGDSTHSSAHVACRHTRNYERAYKRLSASEFAIECRYSV